MATSNTEMNFFGIGSMFTIEGIPLPTLGIYIGYTPSVRIELHFWGVGTIGLSYPTLGNTHYGFKLL